MIFKTFFAMNRALQKLKKEKQPEKKRQKVNGLDNRDLFLSEISEKLGNDIMNSFHPDFDENEQNHQESLDYACLQAWRGLYAYCYRIIDNKENPDAKKEWDLLRHLSKTQSENWISQFLQSIISEYGHPHLLLTQKAHFNQIPKNFIRGYIFCKNIDENELFYYDKSKNNGIPLKLKLREQLITTEKKQFDDFLDAIYNKSTKKPAIIQSFKNDFKKITSLTGHQRKYKSDDSCSLEVRLQNISTILFFSQHFSLTADDLSEIKEDSTHSEENPKAPSKDFTLNHVNSVRKKLFALEEPLGEFLVTLGQNKLLDFKTLQALDVKDDRLQKAQAVLEQYPALWPHLHPLWLKNNSHLPPHLQAFFHEG